MRAGVWNQRGFTFGANCEQMKKVYGGYKSQEIFSEPTLENEEVIHKSSMGRG